MIIDRFINFLTHEKRYSVHTILAYKADLNEFQTFVAGTYDITDLTKVESTYIRSWIVTLLRADRSNATINRKIASLKSFYKFVQTSNNRVINPTKGLVLPKKQSQIPNFIKENEIDKLLDSFEATDDFIKLRDKTIIELLYATGMRRSELMTLKISNFYFEQQYIKVLGKRNKERILPIGRHLITNLKTYWELRKESFGLEEPYFFLTKKGKPLYPKAIYNIVKSYLEGFTTVQQKSPHVLRHSFATHLLNNGVELNAIKELLGHESLAATQIYTHTTLKKLKKAYLRAHPKATN